MKTFLYTAFNKALSVIESSNNSIHLKAAKTYANLFFQTFTTHSQNNFGRFKSLYADDYIAGLYETLLTKIEEKEKKFLK